MSAPAILPVRRPAGASPAETPRRGLRPVERTSAHRRPRLAYGILAVAGAVAIGAAQMTLSILTTQGTYEVAQLTQQQRELTWEQQMLFDDVAGLSSPQYLAANAAALGMVIDDSPSYLRLSDGAIIGSSQGASSTSSVDAIGRGTVQNSLIDGVPLVTAPDATVDGVIVPEQTTSASTTPPPTLTDGLPTPSTH